MYFDQSSGLTVQDAANAVHTFWDACKAIIIGGYTMQVESVVADVDYTTDKVVGVESVSVAAVAGTLGGDPNPWATQGLVEWRTGVYLGGREIRGRTFIPGTPETYSTAGVPTSAYTAPLQAAANALKNDPLSAFVIYSRKKSAIGVVTAATVWSKWAVLRSRRD